MSDDDLENNGECLFFCYDSVLLCHSCYSATNCFISNGLHHFFHPDILSPVCSTCSTSMLHNVPIWKG